MPSCTLALSPVGTVSHLLQMKIELVGLKSSSVDVVTTLRKSLNYKNIDIVYAFRQERPIMLRAIDKNESLKYD